jgi:hypothetical protein
MEFSGGKQGRFPPTYKKYVDPLLKVNGIIQGKNINITICPTARKNHINVDLANQLMVLEPDIIKNDTCLSDEKYDIKNLQHLWAITNSKLNSMSYESIKTVLI